MKNQDSIIEREIMTAIGDMDPGGDDFSEVLESKVRGRLSARAVLGDIAPKYVCPAGHETEWSDVLIVVGKDGDARYPLVFVQCPTCIDINAEDMKKKPLDWAEFDIKFVKPQIRWIKVRAQVRLDEIDELINVVSGEDKRSMLKERKLVESILGRATVALDE
jgi:hypothetical protein